MLKSLICFCICVDDKHKYFLEASPRVLLREYGVHVHVFFTFHIYIFLLTFPANKLLNNLSLLFLKILSLKQGKQYIPLSWRRAK